MIWDNFLILGIVFIEDRFLRWRCVYMWAFSLYVLFCVMYFDIGDDSLVYMFILLLFGIYIIDVVGSDFVVWNRFYFFI